MSDSAYEFIQRAVEGAIPDLSLMHYPVLDKRNVNVLLHHNIEEKEATMKKLIQNYPKYHFVYQCNVNSVTIEITRKSSLL